MSGRIEPLASPSAAAPVTPTAAAATAATTPAGKTKAAKRSHDLEIAAREFEQIFVRSMLKSSPMGAKGDVYGDLAVDAMAKSVTAGRGLGLGDLIKHAVEKSEEALKVRK